MTAVVIQGDARRLPLADDSVDLIVTSPPYWGLRSYTDGGEHYDGQIGAEATPGEYIDALIDCTREWMRVLKPSGSIFVNLGDKYNGSGGRSGQSNANGRGQRTERHTNTADLQTPVKSLLFLPERYRIACVDRLGLIGRAVICWSKPNGLPESVTDRVRRSHEDWVHLTRQPRYFSAVDEIRETHRYPNDDRSNRQAGSVYAKPMNGHMNGGPNPLGRLPGSVWEIATQPLTVPAELGVDHFAAFPIEWPRRIIQGWSPSGICTACGEGRRPVAESLRPKNLSKGLARREASNAISGGFLASTLGDKHGAPSARITGYACACPDATAPTRPATVVDPFGGTGTTALAADVLGRTGISIDASSDYCRIAQWRTSDPGERARALGVPKPPVELPGQQALFELGAS